jgi:Na+-translocating ferredoxin:NAD+ oxidoreductase RnfG subunit
MVIIETKKEQRLRRLKRVLSLLAVLSLLVAYVGSFIVKENGVFETVQAAFPDKIIEKGSGSIPVYRIMDRETGALEGDLVVRESQGWGGPLKTAIWIGPDKTVRGVKVLSHRETPSFFQHLVGNGFFEQFSGKGINAPLTLGEDVDAVSGATISSMGFTKSVREGAHLLANERYGIKITEPPVAWHFGMDEIILVLLYSVVLISLVKKVRKLRFFTLGGGVLFLGIHMNRPISLSNMTSILLGYLPSAHEQLFWWLLVVGVLLLTLVMGKNFYCYWMCPFGGMQEFVTKIGGVRFRLSKKVTGVVKYTAYLLLWLALMITFLTGNPAMGTFEPFATLFSLKGVGVQWYLVSVTIVGSFFIPRFWCRFFCPVGVCLNRVGKVKSVFRRWYGHNVAKAKG